MGTPTQAKPGEVIYPYSDGKPIGETPRHFAAFAHLYNVLSAHFHDHADVLVAGDIFVYYEEGNNRRHVSPDILVSRGVPKKATPERTSYQVWQEGKAMDFVIELTSASTLREDTETKFELYQQLGVQEYILFDPYEVDLIPALQGFTLVNGGRIPAKCISGFAPRSSGGRASPGQPTHRRNAANALRGESSKIASRAGMTCRATGKNASGATT